MQRSISLLLVVLVCACEYRTERTVEYTDPSGKRTVEHIDPSGKRVEVKTVTVTPPVPQNVDLARQLGPEWYSKGCLIDVNGDDVLDIASVR